ncbi:hypothetical protein GCM10009583_11930 [Ornithinicoccus hortensis]
MICGSCGSSYQPASRVMVQECHAEHPKPERATADAVRVPGTTHLLRTARVLGGFSRPEGKRHPAGRGTDRRRHLRPL